MNDYIEKNIQICSKKVEIDRKIKEERLYGELVKNNFFGYKINFFVDKKKN